MDARAQVRASSTPPDKERRGLRENVFAARLHDSVVFLDVDQDKYSCVRGESARLFEQAVADPATMDASLQGTLEYAGLLAGVQEPATQPQFTSYALPARELPEQPLSANVFRAVRVAACLRAADKLRSKRSLHQMIQERREQRAQAALLRSDDSAVVNAALAFAAWRPNESRRDTCMPDSLALLSYLGRHAVFVDWVFAVCSPPFAAHCWVQYGDLVLNDTLDHTRLYTPIMIA